MEIIKYRNNTRQYYKDSYLMVVGPMEKMKIKASESEYLEIQKIFSEVSLGITENELQQKFSKYKVLINLFIKKDIFYKIDSKKLDKHLSHDYFPWIEEKCDDVSSKLDLLEKVKIKIPKNFYGANYLMNLYSKNGILSKIEDVETFQIFVDGLMVSEYQAYKNSSNEIIISPLGDKKYKLVNEEHISERILSHFIFYSTILTSINTEEKVVFLINEFMEVTKKKLFENIELKERSKDKKISLDPILNLNALEKFLRLYDSKIVSFNENKEYNTYLQSPMQVITIQTSDLANHYFSDVSYERLAEFISESVFIEVIKRYYKKDFIVKIEDKLVHKTNFSNEKALYLLSLDEINDGDLLQSVLAQENSNISIFIQTCEDESKFVLIRNEKTQEIYKYKIPIQKIGQVTTILFTWISSKINLVDPAESWFEKVDIDLNYTEDHMSATNIFEKSSAQTYEGKTNNLDNILTECEFCYHVLEVE